MKKSFINQRLLLQIMKNTFLQITISLIFTVVCLAKPLNGQDLLHKKVSLTINNESLSTALSKLEKVAEFRFSYNSRSLKLNQIVNIDAKNEPLANILSKMLIPHKIGYIQVSNRIVLRKIDSDEVGIQATTEKIENITQAIANLEFSVKGKITDENGEALVGVNVRVKDTNIGSFSNDKGEYTINAPGNNAILVFSFIGMKTKEVIIGSQSNIDVILTTAAGSLDEVIVVGYGSESKRKMTSSVSQISTTGLQTVPATSLSNLLAGQASGVAVSTVGGRPGTTSAIRIRGASTGGFGGNTNPLYVIDNIISTKELFDMLDVSEVETVSILKDAAATSIYGSRASNGVVLVKTKSGKKGKPTLSFNTTYGTSNEVIQPTYTTAYEHALLINQAVKAGLDPIIPNSGHGITPISSESLDYLKNNPFPNHQGAIGITPTFQRYSLNVSGATDIVDYFVGGSYVNEGGTMPNLNYKKYNLRAKVGINISKDLRLTLNTNYGKDNDYQFFWPFDGESLSDSYRQAGRRGNWSPAFINGLPVANYNAFSIADFSLNNGGGTRQRDTDLLNNIIELDYKVPFIKGLSAGVTYNSRLLSNVNTTWIKPNVAYTFQADPTNPFKLTDVIVSTRTRNEQGVNSNSLQKSNSTDRAYQLNARINYDKSFGDHSIKATAMYEQFEINNDSYAGIRRNLLTQDIQQLFATSSKADDGFFSGFQRESGRLSYIGSLAYSYKEKYFLNAAARIDASSAFRPGIQYGAFPSVSAGWIISNEKFFENVKAIDFLKLRGSFGKTGTDNITGTTSEYLPFAYLSGFGAATANSSYVFGNGNLTNNVITASGSFPAVNATWDKTNSYNIGVDFAFLQNKLTATIEAFKNHKYDMFGQKISIVPIELGANAPAVNYGQLDVKGFEFDINYKNNLTSKLSYNIGLHFGFAKDKILVFDESPVREYQRFAGYSSDRVTGYIADGIIRTQGELDALIGKGYKFNNNSPYLGSLVFRDIRGNSTIDPNGNTPDGVVDANDVDFIGNHSTPPINYGVTLGISYQNFSIEAIIYGLEGFQRYIPATGRFRFDTVGEGAWSTWNDAFEPDTNPDGKMPRFVGGFLGDPSGQNSSFWLKNAGFGRLKNLNALYKIPTKYTNKIGIKNASLFYNGSNLFMLYSHIKEFDPELQGEGLPINRTHSFGIQINL